MGEVATAISDEARAKHHEFLRAGRPRHLQRPHLLVAEHQHLPRPALGPRAGDLRRGPLPHRAHGRGLRQGLAGRRSRSYLKLVATPKHFAVHSGPEISRHEFDARVSERDLRETYLPAFEACVKEGAAASIMGAYNRLERRAVLRQPDLAPEDPARGVGLRGLCRLRLLGHQRHLRRTPGRRDAGRSVGPGGERGVRPGVRLCILGPARGGRAGSDRRGDDRSSRDALVCGTLPPGHVRSAGSDALRPDSHTRSTTRPSTAASRCVPRENPSCCSRTTACCRWRKDLKSIAVIGPNADDLAVLLGNYCGTPSHAVTPLEGIRRKVSPETVVYTAQGCEIAAGVPPLSAVPAACLRPPADSTGHASHGLSGAYFPGRTIPIPINLRPPTVNRLSCASTRS